MKIHKYILEIVVFICGAVVMIFELVGSRVLGPYFGVSISIWTSLIGIILGSLSLGYYLGGVIADKRVNYKIFSLIVILSAFCIGLTLFIKDFLLIFLQTSIPNINTSSVIASVILFSPTSIFLGMVSPYAAKLKLISLENSGATIGNLYAISTTGSIFGTFLAGFYLIPHFGTNKLLIILTITLVVVSFLLSAKDFFKLKITILVIVIVGWIAIGGFGYIFFRNGFIDVDTSYSRIWIYDDYDTINKESVRTLLINNEKSSKMFLNKNGLVFEYTKYYNLARYFNPNFKSTLMLGGAGYSYPKDFLLNYPNATMDVVEIDPKVTELARKYFNLKDNPRLNIYHEDGRVYLNRTQNKYDIVFGDAFTSFHSLPYQMTTKEAVRKIFGALNDNGVAIVNIISSIEGVKGQFLRAEYATYKDVFPQVYLFPVNDQNDGEKVQNIILVALKSGNNSVESFLSNELELNGYLQHLWKKKINLDMPILTDDFAPVDYYINKII